MGSVPVVVDAPPKIAGRYTLYARVFNKTKDSVIIKNLNKPLETLSWKDFNEKYEFDEKDKTKAYLKEQPKKKVFVKQPKNYNYYSLGEILKNI